MSFKIPFDLHLNKMFAVTKMENQFRPAVLLTNELGKYTSIPYV